MAGLFYKDIAMNLKLDKKILELDKILYALIGWEFVNFFLHLISDYTPFITVTVDYIILAIEFLLLAYISYSYKKLDYDIVRFDRFINYLIACDLWELFIIIFSKSRSPKIIFFIYVIKVFIVIFLLSKIRLDVLRIYDVKDNRYLLCAWIFINFLILILIIMCIKGDDHTRAVFIFIYIRYLLAIYYIYDTYLIMKTKMPHKESIKNNNVSKFNKLKYVKYFLVSIILTYGVAVVVLSNIYVEGKQKLSDDKGSVLTEQTSTSSFVRQSLDVYSYSVENLMPYKSIFHDEKYGIVNVKTGFNSGAIFNDEPQFDNDGISPDYRGHFVNLKGKKIFDIPLRLRMKKSKRQLVSEDFFNIFKESHIPFFKKTYSSKVDCNWNGWNYLFSVNKSGICVLNSGYFDRYFQPDYEYDQPKHYFDNGMAFFYSELKGAYGIISDKGKILKKPIYDKIGLQAHYDMIPVHIKYGEYNVLDADLNYIIDEKLEDVSIDTVLYNQKKIFYNYKDETLGDQNRWVKDIDINGKSEADYWSTDYRDYQDSYFSLTKHLGDKESVVVFKDEKEIYESDEYIKIEICCHDDRYYMLCINKAGDFYVTDMEGNQIIPGCFSDYCKAKDGKFFLKSVDADHIGKTVIADLDGNIKYTDYEYYVDRDNFDNDNLKVIKVLKFDKKSYTVFNWVDLNGELLYDWYLYRGEVKDYHYYDDKDEEVVFTYVADLNENGKPYIHWYDISGNKVLSLPYCYYGDELIDFNSERLFGTDICRDRENIEYFDKRVFWVQNEEGTLDFYNVEGEYLGTEESSYDYIYREPME